MKIIAEVNVYNDMGNPRRLKIEITDGDIANIAEKKALEQVTGISAELINLTASFDI